MSQRLNFAPYSSAIISMSKLQKQKQKQQQFSHSSSLKDPDTATALAAAAGVKAPAQAEPSDPTEVYVSNTSEAVAQSHLQEFFCMIGELESVTKQGHYFVIKYKDALKAQTALALDHTELMGKMIRVTKGKPSPALVAATGVNPLAQVAASVAAQINTKIGETATQIIDPKADEIARTIHIGNVNASIKIEQLMEFFSGVCGNIAFAKMAGDNNHQTRFAFIEFEKRESVKIAVDSCNGIMLGDRAIKVNHAKSSISKPFQSTNSLAANSLAVKGKLGTIMQQLNELKSFGGVQVAANSTIGTAASAQSQLGASLMYLKNLSEQSGAKLKGLTHDEEEEKEPSSSSSSSSSPSRSPSRSRKKSSRKSSRDDRDRGRDRDRDRDRDRRGRRTRRSRSRSRDRKYNRSRGSRDRRGRDRRY